MHNTISSNHDMCMDWREILKPREIIILMNNGLCVTGQGREREEWRRAETNRWMSELKWWDRLKVTAHCMQVVAICRLLVSWRRFSVGGWMAGSFGIGKDARPPALPSMPGNEA